MCPKRKLVTAGLQSRPDSQMRQISKPVLKRIQCSQSDMISSIKERHSVQLIALDLRGTLLNSQQCISDETKDVIEEAVGRGYKVILATGKARSAAVRVCHAFGLYGHRGVISDRSAGVFLQGLDVYTVDGRPIKGPDISPEVVRSAFEYASENGISIVGLSGDHCVTLNRTPDVVDLHERCFDPLAEVMPSVDAILQGPPIKKLVFLSDETSIKNELKPYWEHRLNGTSTQTMSAVSSMLELIPKGTNKWIGLQSLLKSMPLTASSCMAIGDGHNDYEMIKNVAVGVAMGNAVEDLKSIADYTVASNDEGGVAEAFNRFIFSNG